MACPFALDTRTTSDARVLLCSVVPGLSSVFPVTWPCFATRCAGLPWREPGATLLSALQVHTCGPFTRDSRYIRQSSLSFVFRPLSALRSTHSAIPLPTLQHLQMPRLGRKQLLRLSNQTSRVLLLDFRMRDEGGVLRLDDAGAAFGEVDGPGRC